MKIETIVNGSSNNRLIIHKKSSGFNFLIDTGANISLVPKKFFPKAYSSMKLFATNGFEINTYGLKTLTLNLGLRRIFKWKFCIPNIHRHILGADFLSHFGILVDMKNKKLIDSITGLSNKGRLYNINHFTVCTTIQDSPFHKILSQFPELTSFTPISVNKIHQVEYHIITKDLLIAFTPRLLSDREKLKFAKKNLTL